MLSVEVTEEKIATFKALKLPKKDHYLLNVEVTEERLLSAKH